MLRGDLVWKRDVATQTMVAVTPTDGSIERDKRELRIGKVRGGNKSVEYTTANGNLWNEFLNRRSFCGTLSALKASDLGSIVIQESLARAHIKPEDVSEVILGQGKDKIQQDKQQWQLAFLIMNGYMSIKAEESQIVVAGGQESMSQSPHVLCLRNGVKIGNSSLIDTLVFDGLTDAFHDIHMGITAENVSKDFNISRKEQDVYALTSQQKVKAAMTAGYFDKEIVPVKTSTNNKLITLEKDEYPKFKMTMEYLQKLKPAFLEAEGTVTAGNSSGINDGAAAVVLMSAEIAAQRGLSPLAKIVAMAQVGMEPRVMGIGPIPAIELVLQKAKWTKEEVDLYEVNEAFASQSIACIRTLDLDPNKVNINGGAIALGHPIGASGARVLVTLLHSLERIDGNKGVASLCIGGGMGIAIAVQRK
ncbi:Acetyl-CoA acetyltransferase, cytosolic [Eufriesea mexicana]|nr:Acetyl-CoA acetyltransferase, cytosolic [Eufriesea mexicana]